MEFVTFILEKIISFENAMKEDEAIVPDCQDQLTTVEDGPKHLTDTNSLGECAEKQPESNDIKLVENI